jgi:hypothetical protein
MRNLNVLPYLRITNWRKQYSIKANEFECIFYAKKNGLTMSGRFEVDYQVITSFDFIWIVRRYLAYVL